MRIAILHYHLKRGGVTRVIETAVSALQDRGCECVVLAGEVYAGTADLNTVAIDGLGYRNTKSGPSASTVLSEMKAQARIALGGHDPDLWHIHNHSLGKNIIFSEVLKLLVSEGQKILLQIHDFAEDGRPSNYELLQKGVESMEDLYPLDSGIHYAVLNSRDYSYLQRSNCPDSNLHLLPNAVSDFKIPETEKLRFSADRLFVYPTRGIRRKNMGEMALLAALSESNDLFVSTLGPENAVWKPIHDRWEDFVRKHDLSVEYAVVEKSEDDTFFQWMNSSTALLSTSIAEGFGLAFLEPPMFQKQLVGRDIPEITQDFKERGLDLSNLYDRLEIPLDFVPMEALDHALNLGMDGLYHSYKKLKPEAALEEFYHKNVQGNCIDFACLDEALQETVIEAVLKDSALQKSISSIQLNDEKSLGLNREVVGTYGESAYAEKLLGIYSTILSSDGFNKSYLNADSLLNCFLEPQSFRLLRS